jgi:hypothetical protein
MCIKVLTAIKIQVWLTKIASVFYCVSVKKGIVSFFPMILSAVLVWPFIEVLVFDWSSKMSQQSQQLHNWKIRNWRQLWMWTICWAVERLNMFNLLNQYSLLCLEMRRKQPLCRPEYVVYNRQVQLGHPPESVVGANVKVKCLLKC